MSRFRFRLDRVLRARRAVEEIRRAALFEAEHGARTRESAASSAAEVAADALESVRAAQGADEIDPRWIGVAHGAHERSRAVEIALRERALEARAAAARERSAWREVRADVRGLERLSDRMRAEARALEDAREERVIEEFAARRAEEKRREEER